MNTTTKQLPAVIQAEIKRSGLNVRKILVLAVGRGLAVNDGEIVATLGDQPIERVPYHEGGGMRTRASIFVVKGFGGGNYVGVVRPDGFPFSWDAGSLGVACDMYLERGEAVRS